MTGYIKIVRQINKWEWRTCPNTFSVFLYCLTQANHEERKWRGINIKRGQFIGSIEGIAAATGLSSRNTRTCVSKLKRTGEIDVKATNRFSLVTVTEYELYQGEGEKVTNHASLQRQTNDKQLTTTKNERRWFSFVVVVDYY